MPTREQIWNWTTEVATIPFMGMERIYWLYLATAFTLAFYVFCRRSKGQGLSLRGFIGYLFPSRIYRHSSTWVDFKYMLCNKLVKLGLLVFLAYLLNLITRFSYEKCVAWFGASSKPPSESSLWILVAYTLLSALATDFAVFFGHYLQHKFRYLWLFHKVHHSATVLSPITVYRVHPVDDLLAQGIGVVLLGVMQGVTIYSFPPGFQPLTYLQLNVFVFVFYLVGYNLRHSHVWLSYGPFWSRIFMSPAMHQIHHSTNRKHWDKNIGFMLSIWDGMFGTLYIPSDEEEEELEFGLGTGEDHEYSGVLKLYFFPFVQLFQALAKEWGESEEEEA